MSKESKYAREFKLDALNLLQEGKSISGISKSLGISANTLCTWRRRYQLHEDKAFLGLGIRLPKKEVKFLTLLSKIMALTVVKFINKLNNRNINHLKTRID